MINLADRKTTSLFCCVVFTPFCYIKGSPPQMLDIKYKEKSQKSSFCTKTCCTPSRGMILDRNKVDGNQCLLYDINVIYRNVDPNMDTLAFCKLLGIDKQTFITNLNKDWKNPLYHKSVPFTFYQKYGPSFAKFHEHLHKFPGFYPVLKHQVVPTPQCQRCAGLPWRRNWDIINRSGGEYSPGDYIGISGLEKAWKNNWKAKRHQLRAQRQFG